MPAFDPAAIRPEFPALALKQDGRPVVFLDGPGGTQVPQRVIDAVVAYYRDSNANHGGAFATSVRSDAMLGEARAAVADLLGASASADVKFGQNMTSLTFALSRSIARVLRPGDEVVISRLDHEANRAPWIAAAADAGAIVREVAVDLATCTLDLASLEAALSERTRLVAVGYASNATGTVNPVAEIARRARAAGAWTFVDAVHYAPHGSLDVEAIGADFLACSAYKFFGPHVGILWGRDELLASLPAYKVRPAEDRWETGTQNHEGIAGTLAAIEYLAAIGERFGDPGIPGAAAGSSRRARLVRGLDAIEAHERRLSARLLAGLADMPGLRLHGLADPARVADRTPTFAITLAGRAPRQVAEALSRHGIFAWDGDFYATTLIEDLGLAASGGVVRLGLVHYTTEDEVDRVVAALGAIAAGG
jgi:cysteine desulfurase family protein (TIGR01976 family)